MSSIPDTLYMVEDRQYLHTFVPFNPSSSSTVDIVAGTIPGRYINSLTCNIVLKHIFILAIFLAYFHKLEICTTQACIYGTVKLKHDYS